ncbi:MAG: hypothetical protein ABEI99_10705 [Halobaculum sp.]
MTDDHTTRRDALRAVGAVGLMSGLSTAATAEAPTVRVVEAGLRYELSVAESFDTVHPDSRPPYTVNEGRGELLLLNTASRADRRAIRGAPELANERSVRTGTTVRVDPGEVGALPTELSTRMRAKEAVVLTEQLRTPRVTARPTADDVVLTAEGAGRRRLSSGERTTVALDSVTATVQTSRVVGEADVNDQDVPDFRIGVQREYGSRTVEVRPIVEAVNHGTLTVAQQPDPPENAPE